MRAFVVTGWLLATLMCLPSIALADWSENFDSYILGSELHGQGGWVWWGFGAGATITDDQFRSAEHSVDISAGSDMVHEYTGYTSGKWLYRTYIYIPSDIAGQTYFIMLSSPLAAPTWAVEFSFDSASGLILCECGSGIWDVPMFPYVTDQWSEIRAYVDLDEDWVQLFYNGRLIDDPAVADHPTLGGGLPWTGGVLGGETNPLDIAAVDLFANNATAVYYDDMSLSPAVAWVDVSVDLSASTRIDYAIVAGEDVGTMNVDAWMVLLTPNGPFSYDGAGPTMGWNSGLASPLYTGPLANASGPSLDIPFSIPWPGSYNAIVAIDTIPNGLPDPQDALLMEMQSFTQ